MHLNGKYFLQNACNIYNFTSTFINLCDPFDRQSGVLDLSPFNAV